MLLFLYIHDSLWLFSNVGSNLLVWMLASELRRTNGMDTPAALLAAAVVIGVHLVNPHINLRWRT
jgi:hypothetical protein